MNVQDLTPQQLAAMLGTVDAPALADLPHALLYAARDYAAPEDQKKIAKYEHRAFAREVVGDNPFMAASLIPAIPAYQAYKAVNSKSRSGFDPSQVLQGFIGIGEGLVQAMRK